MENYRIMVILNPTAGQGMAAGREGEIRRLMVEHGLDYELRLTERIGHATDLALEAAGRGFAVVVAAGGDGTANETVNGLMRAAETGEKTPALGVLCVGRGNDFAYGADIPSELEKSVAAIARGRPEPLDVGLVRGGDFPDGKYFVNGMGIGFDTIVGLEARKMKRVHGFMAYVFGALKTLVIYPPAPLVALRYDGGVIEQKSHQISIMNGKRMGGVFFMAPKANNHDGLFDLCMTSSLTRRQMLAVMARYTKGTQAEHPLVTIGVSARYVVEAPAGGLVVHADGETVCLDGRRLEIECRPAALAILCAREGSA